MASEEKGASGGAEAVKGPSKAPLILALVNTLAVAGALGMLAYTRLVYQRPAITEHGERERLAAAHASPAPPPTPGLILFEPVTVNIEASPASPKPADGTPQQIQGKLHYATLGFGLELRDMARKDDVEGLRPVIMDKLLGILARKPFQELATVQGRYVLRAQILDLVNQLAVKRAQESDSKDRGSPPDSVATNVYFTQFVVQ